ncbi:heptaprenylglyceryl phosphate synthase [Paenisporosarcina cavernae]|uniref:Heptaprenylglyceryl phosphate synthase n=1 Tax=Paenisporosarcina cavernae TaxID=2320858 RepID=A0A385YXW3_9BACL|nr:heptaprenylglyceryl phosphate synthase [Paenisporosarcina cavernae]AYC30302.1 heptaprenylglyceryl phosphate synthase [Paenisporosarcina cavernae]
MEISSWRHAFKLDPAKTISDESLERVCESGTDGIIIGGTDDITLEGVLDLLMRVRRFTVPVALEISSMDAISPGFDYYFIPTVLNSSSTKWMKDLHVSAIKEFGHMIQWHEMIMEGYCILNPSCKAAIATEADTSLTEEEVIAHAVLAEKVFRLPVFYMEYSGMYGDPVLVNKVKRNLDTTQLFYGGGIDGPDKAAEMAAIADTIIVGNSIYDQFEEALKTVAAVKNSHATY